MLTLDKDTLEIVCPSGDTGILRIALRDREGEMLEQALEGVAIFAVCSPMARGAGYNTQGHLVAQIIDNEAVIMITNSFSRGIEPGQYHWDIRIVTDPEYAEDGKTVICQDDTDEVHSLFAGRTGGMPKYTVPGVALDV